MIPRTTVTTASALLLLGSTTSGAFATQNHRPANRPATNSNIAVAHRYFHALNGSGQSGHDYRALYRLYASTITLTEIVTGPLPRTYYGPRQIRAFDEWNQLHWTVLRLESLSPSLVLAVEQPSVKGPGHELEGARPWLTLLRIRDGKIFSLVWMPWRQGGRETPTTSLKG
jgi:hypothetical protein